MNLGKLNYNSIMESLKCSGKIDTYEKFETLDLDVRIAYSHGAKMSSRIKIHDPSIISPISVSPLSVDNPLTIDVDCYFSPPKHVRTYSQVFFDDSHVDELINISESCSDRMEEN